MTDIPSIRQRKRRFGLSVTPQPEATSTTEAATTTTTSSRLVGLWKPLALVILSGAGLAFCTAIVTNPTAAPSAASSPAPEPQRTAAVPLLSVGPETEGEPPTIVRVHPEPAEDHKGCYVLAGVAVPLTDYHLVGRPRGTFLTASLPLLCTTGEDLRLRILLDCPPAKLCRSAGLFSLATRMYYTVPNDDLELHYKNGTSRDSYPTHLLILRPTRLKKYADWGLD